MNTRKPKDRLNPKEAESFLYGIAVIRSHCETITRFVGKYYFDKVTLTKRLGRLNVSAADDLLAAEDAVCFCSSYSVKRKEYYSPPDKWPNEERPILGTHSQIGWHMKYAIDELWSLYRALSDITPKPRKGLNAIDRFLKALGSVRSQLDELVFQEHPSNRERISTIYYGDREKSFYDWITTAKIRDNCIVDLRDDILRDSEFPRHNVDKQRIASHLGWCQACDEAMQAFERAWKSYKAYQKRTGSP